MQLERYIAFSSSPQGCKQWVQPLLALFVASVGANDNDNRGDRAISASCLGFYGGRWTAHASNHWGDLWCSLSTCCA